MRFRASMKAAVSARLADAGRERSARRSPRASEILSTRRDRPVTSATASCPKCCTIWSSADGTGGSAASFSISASRRATASWQSTGLPSPSNTGRENRLPLSSVNGSCNCTGKAWARNSITVSLGVRSTERSSHSEAGISAMRRSISASPVETSWMTAERPEARSASIARISDGHFMAVSRWPKKRCLAPSKAESAAALAFRFSVSSPSTMPVAFSASWMLRWMILKAPA